MSIDILMPALSPTMEEGTLAKWHVKEGDTVKAGQVIAEIETDKATMEVEAVDEGIVARILIPAGSQGVKVNAPIAILAADGETVSAAAAAPAAVPAAAALAATQTATVSAPVTPATVMTVSAPLKTDNRVFASPLAKRIAAASNVDLSAVQGSGPHGRIIKRDVEAKLGKTAAQPAVQPAAAAAPQAPKAAPVFTGTYDEIPLDGMRRTIARRLTDSFRDVPHFPLMVDIELDALLKLRAELNAASPEGDGAYKLSVNDMLIKASALALKAVPAANASFTESAILRHHHADVAVAVSIEGGLITPVIRKAEQKSLSQISNEMKVLATKARERKLTPEEYQGGTFSLSNLGMFGIKAFSSIINEPQGMILSVGAGEKRPVVKGDALAIVSVMTVTLTCDHRVVDGTVGAEWVNVFKGLIESPLRMLA
jgi:pyruvate dehydrogenase E2 component (dihydrolipoamide acetyltransferase)